MKNKKLYNLIYSKKNNISFKDKNLFIGKWINIKLLNKSKKNIEFYDHQWLSKKKQFKDFEDVKKIYVKVLKELSINLNNYHSKKFTIRQWELILFYFLYNYISVVYDRWNIIKSIKKKYQLKRIQLISYNKESFVCKKSTDVYDLIFSSEWNDWVVSEIIKYQKLKYFTYKSFKKKNIFKRKFEKKTKKYLFRSKKNNNKFFLKDIELSRFLKLKLNVQLNQFKFFYDNPNIDNINNNILKTRKFKKTNSRNNFVNFILKNIYEVLPQNFLENFNEIEKKISHLNWPKNPKVIMTSYSHYNDEVFNVYTAKKINAGTKLVIFQHGHQGHHDLCGTYYEKRVCDKYITWGNRSKEKKVIPLFVSTNIGKKIIKKNPEGILLKLTEFQLIPGKSTYSPREIEGVIVYRNNLINFLSNMGKEIRKITTVKSYDFSNENFITKKIKKNYKDVKIKNFNRLFGRGYEEAYDKKLVIETFNSTGFFELLSMNSPVILLTTKQLFYNKNEYKKYYEILMKNKLIFFDPKKAAEHIKLILPRIDDWWFEKDRQKGIKFFCDNMCKYENDNFHQLPKILKKIAREN